MYRAHRIAEGVVGGALGRPVSRPVNRDPNENEGEPETSDCRASLPPERATIIVAR